MGENKKVSYYYLGANSPYGLFSYYDQIINVEASKKLFIIKGGPGTGKSNFMKKFGQNFENKNCEVEYITCSFDPDSLDGVVLKDLMVAFVDGSEPHVIDPIYPACCDEIINLSQFLDGKEIEKHKSQIIDLSKKIKKKFESAYRYLCAAKKADEDIFEIIKDGFQSQRLKKLSDRISKYEFKKKQNKKGTNTQRFLSGITEKGVSVHFDKINGEYKNVYRLDDHFGISAYLLKDLSEDAQDTGYDVIECYCPTDPKNKLEHLLIKDLSLAFVTSNSYHEYEGQYIRKINMDRYVDEEVKKQNRQKIRFDQKLKNQLIKSAIDEIKSSRRLYDELDKIYISSINFEKIDTLQKEIEEKLLESLAN